MHLETARRYTLKSQGGYLEFPQEPPEAHDEEEFCAKKSDFEDLEQEKSRFFNT